MFWEALHRGLDFMYNFWIQPTIHCDDIFSPSQTTMLWVLKIPNRNFECRLVDCSRSCRCQEALEMISTHPMLVKILHHHQQLSSLVQRLWHSWYVLSTSPCFIHSLTHSLQYASQDQLFEFLYQLPGKSHIWRGDYYDESVCWFESVDLGLFP